MKRSRIRDFLFFVALMAITGCDDHHPRATQSMGKRSLGSVIQKRPGAGIVQALTRLGYFQYASPAHVAALKREVAAAYDHGHVLTTVEDERTGAPYCFRRYNCDAEDLFEVGGLVDKLQEIKPTFDKMGVPLVWADDSFAEDGSQHTIVLNGKLYTAFSGDPETPDAWGQATRNFIAMLNEQLARHHSPERVYPMLGGNEGYIIFLTTPLYQFINANFDAHDGPRMPD
ncbi:hypothetical protein [Hymenobacter terricola]|uniref:hypothetical protein n=1 Tax=Hymenobacter terricola TaxID=2819236 RepID=UPI001B3106BB|nr:hypothetical protein [Hymenobacter terricola]